MAWEQLAKVKHIEIYTALLLSLSVFVSILIFTHGTYFFGHDLSLMVYDSNDLFRGLFVWSTMDYTGIPAITTPLFNYLVGGPAYLISTIASNAAGLITNLWIQYSIGAIGMFYLVLDLTKSYDRPISFISAIMAAFIFVLPISAFGETDAAIIMPIFVLLLLDFTSKFISGKTDYLRFALSALAFSIIISMAGPYFTVQVLILFITAFTIITISIKSPIRIRYTAYIALILIISISANLSWIVGGETFSSSLYNNFLKQTSGSSFMNFYTIHLIGILFSMDYFPTDIVLYPILALSLPIFIISIMGLITSINKHNYTLEVRFTFALLAGFIMLTIFGNTVALPFGSVFVNLYKIFPILAVFRGSFISIHFAAIFVFAALFGFGFVIIGSKIKIRYLRYTFVMLLALLVIIFLYTSTYWLNSYLGSNGLYFHFIPKYVTDLSEYLNNQSGTFNIATLPAAPGWQVTPWYFGVNIYSSMIYKHPVFTGGEIRYNELIFPNSEGLYYKYVGSVINNKSLPKNSSLSNLFGIFGIKFIILQNDVINNTVACNCGVYNFNKTTILDNLNLSENILRVSIFGKLAGDSTNDSLYINTNYVPLVYGSNIRNVSNFTNSAMFAIISDRNFNIQNVSVFSPWVEAQINWSGVKLNPITNFVKPKISFAQKTPTKISVKILNASTPFYLVFRETYDQHWAAFYSNGTEINPRDHIAVNGFANAWYMNKTGNYTITLYYTLQTEAWLAWGVSFAALFVTIGIGVYGWKEIRKERRNKNISLRDIVK